MILDSIKCGILRTAEKVDGGVTNDKIILGVQKRQKNDETSQREKAG